MKLIRLYCCLAILFLSAMAYADSSANVALTAAIASSAAIATSQAIASSNADSMLAIEVCRAKESKAEILNCFEALQREREEDARLQAAMMITILSLIAAFFIFSWVSSKYLR